MQQKSLPEYRRGFSFLFPGYEGETGLQLVIRVMPGIIRAFVDELSPEEDLTEREGMGTP